MLRFLLSISVVKYVVCNNLKSKDGGQMATDEVA